MTPRNPADRPATEPRTAHAIVRQALRMTGMTDAQADARISALLAEAAQGAGRSSDPEPAPTPDRYFLPNDPAVEALAELEHKQWEEWSRTIAEQGLTPDRIERWRGYWVPYADLTDDVKEHDRVWARKAIAALRDAGYTVSCGAVPALQATGEPPSDRITITPDIEGDARRISESLNDMLRGAGATGEGEQG